MPTFNSTEFLTVPQQVNKNKNDINNLDGRVTIVENAILGNTSIIMTDVLNVVSLGVAVPLGVAAANAIKAIITYNYNNPTNYQMFGAKVAIPAAIVNDSIVFPGAADITYDTVFEIQAKQELNPITESYAFVAQGDSPEFSFTIYFSYRFDIGTWEPGGDPIIIVQRQADMKYALTIDGEATVAPGSQGISFAFPINPGYDPDFSGTIWLYTKALVGDDYRLAGIGRFGCNETNVRGLVMCSSGMTLSIAENSINFPGTHYMASMQLWGYLPLGNFYRLIIKADDNRKIELDDWSSHTEVPVLFRSADLVLANAYTDNQTLATGSPASASNFADKNKTKYFPSVVTPSLTTFTLDANAITVTTIATALGQRIDNPSNKIAGLINIIGTNNTGGAFNITGKSVLVITLSSAGEADKVSTSTAAHFIYQSGIMGFNVGANYFSYPAIVTRSGNVVTITLCGNIADTISIPDTSLIRLVYQSL